ncbi:hypothetical protein F5I97DRAFT_1132259 [Phlebopus sp. FC_14]|nr:hypothetical protein F5I97DRAFT_1132259 [Phlebopus sp. FC_14]
MAPGLCENCHKKPKFGTHKFCSKTCAAQAATKAAHSKTKIGRQRSAPAAPKAAQLCDHCGRKPKFQNFDYCGKSCAAQANVAGQTRQKPLPPPTHKTGRVPGAAPNISPAARGGRSTKTVAGNREDDSTDSGVGGDNGVDEEDGDNGDDEVNKTDFDNYLSDLEEENDTPPPPPPATRPAKRPTQGGKTPASRSPPGSCSIPHCGRPSHVDKNGTRTNYCSNKHREEAVVIGLEKPCIMCHRYPQSDSDYFCSSVCRQQSMTKV